MSFLKKILKRVEKSSKNKAFNLKKFAWMEQEELGTGLTPLQQFDAPASPAPTEQVIDPSVSMAMEKYIDQNANAEQLNPMPPEWISDMNLRMNFQNVAQNMLGNMSEAFVSRALQATEIMQETPPQGEQPAQEETWQSQMGDFDIDLVESFFSSPNIEQTIRYISSSIMKSGYRQGIDNDTAEEIALEAVKIALGKPGEKQRGGTRRDQRFNYFLSNPDKMPPDVAQAYRTQAQSMGPDEAIAFLKDNFGEQLMQSMLKQVIGGDPSIKQWVLKNSGNVGSVVEKSLGTSLTGGEERGTNIQDSDIEEMHRNRIQQREEDFRLIDSQKDMISKAALSFSRLYIVDIVRGMKKALSSAVERSYNQYPKFADKIERMQIYNNKLLDQYEQIAMQMPTIDADGGATFTLPSYDASGKIIPRTVQGQFSIPQKDLIDMFGGKLEGSAEDISNDIINQRRRGEVDFDIGDWFRQGAEGQKGKSILPYREVQDSYTDAYNVKKQILDSYQVKDALSMANDPLSIFKGIQGRVLKDESGKVVREQDGQPKVEGGMTSQQMVETLDKLSNIDRNTPKTERQSRRERFINRTINESHDSKNSLDNYRRISEMKWQPGDESKNSLRPNAQWDVKYLMEGLNAEKNDTDKNKFSDVFQAFIGALNPHKKIRQGEMGQYYKNLMGKNDEEFREDTSMLNGKEREEFTVLEKIKNNLQENLNVKEQSLATTRKKADVKAKAYHNKIQKAYEKHLKMLKTQGMPPIELGDYVGVPNWDGESVLTPEDYTRIVQDRGIKIGKIIDTLWGSDDKTYTRQTMPPLRKIEQLTNKPVLYLTDPITKKTRLNPKTNKPMPANIRQQGYNYIKSELDKVEADIEKFKQTHNMTQSQYNMASALCKQYLTKMASIERLQNSCQGIKLASIVVDLDILTCDIEEKFNKDFDNIFRM